ncbi:hypothetical protein KBA41_02195 [Candidatus Ozemobacteraceae bacterium]|nr:hypothetical protein [Candidatus Ozemobacteraceae bacterium]
MLLIPKTTLMGLMTLGGDSAIAPGNGETVMQHLTTHTASMAYYEPGAANREIPQERIIETLFASGLPAPGHPVRLTLDEKCVITTAEGVPERYKKFYEVTLLEYPDGRVGTGDSWVASHIVPISPDPNSETVDCQAVATFTLASVDRDAGEADIAFETRLVSLQPVSSGAAVIDGTAEGKIRVRLSDGIPQRSDSVSRTTLDFGGSNHVDLEQRIRSDFMNRQLAESETQE